MVAAKFIHSIMKDGKKSTAERIFYRAMDSIEERTGQSGVAVFKQAVVNVKPVLEVKSRRVGGATYQVPVEVRPERRQALAFRWIIGFAKSRSEKSFSERLAAELLAASKNEGASVRKKDETHKMADANKAFSHYRW
jgi:small subunit ribosomal protein S7